MNLRRVLLHALLLHRKRLAQRALLGANRHGHQHDLVQAHGFVGHGCGVSRGVEPRHAQAFAETEAVRGVVTRQLATLATIGTFTALPFLLDCAAAATVLDPADKWRELHLALAHSSAAGATAAHNVVGTAVEAASEPFSFSANLARCLRGSRGWRVKRGDAFGPRFRNLEVDAFVRQAVEHASVMMAMVVLELVSTTYDLLALDKPLDLLGRIDLDFELGPEQLHDGPPLTIPHPFLAWPSPSLSLSSLSSSLPEPTPLPLPPPRPPPPPLGCRLRPTPKAASFNTSTRVRSASGLVSTFSLLVKDTPRAGSFFDSEAVGCLGHNNEGLTKAVSDQMATLHHVSNLYYIPTQGKLASWLVKNSPMDRVFFCNSGAEANEAAIKLARKHAHTQRGIDEPVIITCLQSFHGRTLATITATGQPKYQQGFDYGGEMVQGFEYVPYNDAAALKALVAKINAKPNTSLLSKLKFWKQKPKTRAVAAIMVEALQGEGGIKPGSEEFFRTARDLCDETGALLMCDEVQVGMGRTGKLWGFENVGVEPDVISVAKALGGGVPIGAMLCKEAVNVFQPGDHATTYGGNPLACAAGIAVTSAIDDQKLADNAMARGEQLRQGLRDMQADPKYSKVIVDVRGWGLINGLEIDSGGELTAGALVGAAIAEGLLLVPAGTHVVRFVPPLVVTAEDVDDASAALRQPLTSAFELLGFMLN
eukprot:CAMPEP_0171793338 /NCGR_PEP_ID=MMETSP0991-20121206/67498_1 /TAXON_ID=483369 /ORGANISM="non described non described, Strain CCMP2098" /LENGTH=706 /DNA_ID=CAMNT_0012403585 /DNA_START=803 /DNA_END=2926 /DNA_ORIENTATION=-